MMFKGDMTMTKIKPNKNKFNSPKGFLPGLPLLMLMTS